MAMFVPGALLPVAALFCWRFTPDMPAGKKKGTAVFGHDQAGHSHRIRMLAASYGAGFSVGIIGTGGGSLLKAGNPPGSLFDSRLVILACSLCAVAVRFSPAQQQAEPLLHELPMGAVA